MPTSQNGWSASPGLRTRPMAVAGESFSPGVRDHDDVYDVLQYVAEQLHERVEPIVRPGWHQADDWGFYYRPNANDPGSLSNHSSATAIDYNATRHPNGVPTGKTWTRAQVAEIHRILAEVDHVVRWGGDYTRVPDSMHFEINAGPHEVAAAAKKVRALGRRRNDGPTRVEQFLAGGPPRYDLALLDDAVAKGNRSGTVKAARDRIDDAMRGLHDDRKRTRVRLAKQAWRRDRVLRVGQLRLAAAKGGRADARAALRQIDSAIELLEGLRR